MTVRIDGSCHTTLMALIGQALLLGYVFARGSVTNFVVKVDFDGFIPIFGGKEAKASVTMMVSAKGIESPPGLVGVESEITSLKVLLNGSALPLNEKSIAAFFPKATATFDSLGRVKSNSAPNIVPLVRLPGLDAQRLPEISYVPIELPAAGVSNGVPYSFARTFGGSKVEYEVTPLNIDEEYVNLKFSFRQVSTSFEDDRANLVVKDKATRRIEATFTGTGTARFDRRKSHVTSLELSGTTMETVIPEKTGARSTRELRTKMSVQGA